MNFFVPQAALLHAVHLTTACMVVEGFARPFDPGTCVVGGNILAPGNVSQGKLIPGEWSD